MHISGGLDLFFIRVLPSTPKTGKNLSLSLPKTKLLKISLSLSTPRKISLSLSTRTNPRLMEKRSDRPHRKPCQQFTYGYVRKSYIH